MAKDKQDKSKIKEALQTLLSYRGVYFGNSSEESFKALETYARDQGILPKVRPGSDRDEYGNRVGYTKAWSKDATKAEQLAELESCFETLLAWKTETPANIDKVIDALYKTYLEIVKPQLVEDEIKKAADVAEVKEAIKTILKYKDDLPDELKAAVGTTCEYAVAQVSGNDTDQDEEDTDDLED